MEIRDKCRGEIFVTNFLVPCNYFASPEIIEAKIGYRQTDRQIFDTA